MSNAIMETFAIDNGEHLRASYDDWGWVLNNPHDCIGDPVKQSSVVTVPFGKTYDLADELVGFPFFTGRTITLKLGVKLSYFNQINSSSYSWREYISEIRNYYEGQNVELYFDNEYTPGTTWWYSGRAFIRNFSATRDLGTFDFVIEALPYKELSTWQSESIVYSPNTIRVSSPYATPIYFWGTVNSATTFTIKYPDTHTRTGKTISYTLAAGVYDDYALPGFYALGGDDYCEITVSGNVVSGSKIRYLLRSL